MFAESRTFWAHRINVVFKVLKIRFKPGNIFSVDGAWFDGGMRQHIYFHVLYRHRRLLSSLHLSLSICRFSLLFLFGLDIHIYNSKHCMMYYSVLQFTTADLTHNKQNNAHAHEWMCFPTNTPLNQRHKSACWLPGCLEAERAEIIQTFYFVSAYLCSYTSPHKREWSIWIDLGIANIEFRNIACGGGFKMHSSPPPPMHAHRIDNSAVTTAPAKRKSIWLNANAMWA